MFGLIKCGFVPGNCFYISEVYRYTAAEAVFSEERLWLLVDLSPPNTKTHAQLHQAKEGSKGSASNFENIITSTGLPITSTFFLTLNVIAMLKISRNNMQTLLMSDLNKNLRLVNLGPVGRSWFNQTHEEISFKVGPFKVYPFEVSPFEVSPFEVSPFEVSPFEVSPFEVSPHEARMSVDL
jgi:hypothetical protein